MKTWIVSLLDEETIHGEETIQGRKLYEEIRYQFRKLFFKTLIYHTNAAQFLTVYVKVSESPIKIIIGFFSDF